jgi:hypothetical protein
MLVRRKPVSHKARTGYGVISASRNLKEQSLLEGSLLLEEESGGVSSYESEEYR